MNFIFEYMALAGCCWSSWPPLLYADDEDITAKSEDEIQMTVNKLNKTAKKCGMKIFS
jgi:hypothetical protein